MFIRKLSFPLLLLVSLILLIPDNLLAVSLKWKIKIEGVLGSSGVNCAPVVGAMGERVYVVTHAANYAVNAASGTMIWQQLGPLWAAGSQSLGFGEILYSAWQTDYAAFQGNFTPPPSNNKHDPKAGKTLWTSEATETVSFLSPAISLDGTVYVVAEPEATQNRGYSFFALNPLDGSVLWQHPVGCDKGWIAYLVGPVIGPDGIIYFALNECDGKNEFIAIRPNGNVKWTQTEWQITSTPAFGNDGTLYAGIFKREPHPDHPNACLEYPGLGAFDPSGALKWRFSTFPDEVHSSPAIGPDGTLYFGTDGGKFYAVTPMADRGEQKWQYETGGEISSSPAIAKDGTVVFGCSDKKVYALTSAGTERWTYTTGDEVKSSPAFGPDGTVYIGSMDTYLYALTDNNGGPADTPWATFRGDRRRTGSAECLEMEINDGTLAIPFSCVRFLESDYSCKFRHVGGLKFELDINSFSAGGSSPCVRLAEDLSINIACISFAGIRYGFTLEYLTDLLWEIDLDSFVIN